MALYSQASDLQTRSTVWVGTNVAKGRSQANSHTRNWDHDGISAAELADLCTDYQGWQGPGPRYWHAPGAKRISWVA